MKRKPLWPTVWDFTHSHANTRNKYLLSRAPFSQWCSRPELKSYLTEILQYHTKVLTGSLCSIQSVHFGLQRIMEPTVPVILKYYLFPPKMKAQVGEDRTRSIEMTRVKKQNCIDRVRPRKKAIRRFVFMQLQQCWLLKLSQELVASGFLLHRPGSRQSLSSFPEKHPVTFYRSKHLYRCLDHCDQEFLSFL